MDLGFWHPASRMVGKVSEIYRGLLWWLYWCRRGHKEEKSYSLGSDLYSSSRTRTSTPNWLEIGGKIYEISIIANAFSIISVASDSEEQGFNRRSKQVCVSKTEQSINSNLKSADAPRVGPKKTTLGQLKAKAQLQQKTSDQTYVLKNEQPIDPNLKSAEDPRVGPKSSKATLGQLKTKAQLQQKSSDHLYYSRRKKGNLICWKDSQALRSRKTFS